MSIGHNAGTAQHEARLWTPILNRYREPSRLRGAAELAITALPLVALWIAAWLLHSAGFWWASLLTAIPAAGFLVRLGELIIAQKAPEQIPAIEQLPHHAGGRWQRERTLLGFTEAQVTAEGECYDEEGLLRLLRLARIGCSEIFAAQIKASAA